MSEFAYGLEPLAGGFGGETFLATAGEERSVVRLYTCRGATRGPQAPAVDAAVLRLVRGLLPVPEVLEVRRAETRTGTPGLLVTSFLPGVRLDRLLPTLDEADRERLGGHLGALTARLAGMPLPVPGLFADERLSVEPFAAADLPGFLGAHLAGTKLAGWPAEERAGLDAVLERAQTLLDRVGRTCLVHGDLNPKNLLVDPDTLVVTGVLDWELAHAGLPVSDLGNLLRLERDPVLTTAAVAAHTAAVPDAGADLLETARAADLVALVELAGRRGENPVADLAHDRLWAVATTGDLAATGEAGDGLDDRRSGRVS